MPDTELTIGELLRRARLAQQLNQEDVASILGVHQATIAKWERGDRPNADKLQVVADFLDLDINELYSIWHGVPVQTEKPMRQEITDLRHDLAAVRVLLEELLGRKSTTTKAGTTTTRRRRRPA